MTRPCFVWYYELREAAINTERDVLSCCKVLVSLDLNGGEEMGMTNEQYKGMLLDELEDWQEILDLAIETKNTEIQKKAEKQIAKINQKLKF